jgi:hypothetical protein
LKFWLAMSGAVYEKKQTTESYREDNREERNHLRITSGTAIYDEN